MVFGSDGVRAKAGFDDPKGLNLSFANKVRFLQGRRKGVFKLRYHSIGADRPRLVAAATMAAILLAGCATGRGGSIPYRDAAAFGAPDVPTIVALEQGYRIAPLDTLSVKVFKMPDLSGDYEVDLTGQISVPLIGEVSAINLTTADLDRRLTTVLGEKYLENPDVSVGVKSSTKHTITVDGSVKSPGALVVGGKVSLLQAVAQAGGPADDANIRRVAVFRQIDGKRQAAAFDLSAIRRGQADDPPLYAGDIVVVDGSTIKALQKKILSALPLLSIFSPL